jgi:hypothetical protein
MYSKLFDFSTSKISQENAIDWAKFQLHVLTSSFSWRFVAQHDPALGTYDLLNTKISVISPTSAPLYPALTALSNEVNKPKKKAFIPAGTFDPRPL